MLGAVPTVHDGRGLSVCVIREVSSFQRVGLGPEDVLEKYRLQWSWDLKMCPYWRGVLISEDVMYY